METVKKLELSTDKAHEAMNFLMQQDLMGYIIKDLDTLGLVGEDQNKILTYLVATSRKMENPLACVIRGDSSSGKSCLAETVVKLIPDKEKEALTRITKQVLFYENNLANKLIYIKEADGCEESISNIRTLLSEKKLSLKRLVGTKVESFEVKGPVAFIETTANEMVENQTATRVFEIWMDESQEQTEEIHKIQKRQYGLAGAFKRKPTVSSCF